MHTNLSCLGRAPVKIDKINLGDNVHLQHVFTALRDPTIQTIDDAEQKLRTLRLPPTALYNAQRLLGLQATMSPSPEARAYRPFSPNVFRGLVAAVATDWHKVASQQFGDLNPAFLKPASVTSGQKNRADQLTSEEVSDAHAYLETMLRGWEAVKLPESIKNQSVKSIQVLKNRWQMYLEAVGANQTYF
jgi:hypothetical protein